MQEWQEDCPSLLSTTEKKNLWSLNFFLSSIKVANARSKHLFIKITVDIFFTGRLSTLGWNHPSQPGKRKKKVFSPSWISPPPLHLTLFVLKWVEIHLFRQRSSWLQHPMCLNKLPALEAFFRLSVSLHLPLPSPLGPDWHLVSFLYLAPRKKKKKSLKE